MESKPDRRLIIVAVLAFIGVILLVATVVLTCTALFTWLEASGGSPRLNVWEIRGELPPENASIIHLTEKDFEQHPALDSAIRGDNRDPGNWYQGDTPYGVLDKRTIGSAPVTYVERGVLIESFGPDVEARNQPYLEYEGAYYYFLTLIP
ncbi:hypothetical protein [Methanoculleus bourgensis]|uniref:hypothetical protein n=1 Tax=Methanoculleus bourgensis TaxID=83986 RepID=UPI0022EF6258|nr:hypothetical protein [Methanoculleus bourgensis]GLI45338.1 hypothetical protein MBOURGENBZM_01300 [Methanoculleus bourgensis]